MWRSKVCVHHRAASSKLNYSELYDLEPCAAFVANYLEYETLENPILFPKSIPSPYTVMEWQAGDCFDLAIVLCSLLLGVGYDAYVCVGYAPKFITTNDQAGTICPVLEREAAAKAAAAAAAANGEKKVVKESKYRIKPIIDLTSKVDLEEERLEREVEARETAKSLEKLRVQEEREEQRHAAEGAALEAEATAEEAKEMEVAFASAEGEAAAEGEGHPRAKRSPRGTMLTCALRLRLLKLMLPWIPRRRRLASTENSTASVCTLGSWFRGKAGVGGKHLHRAHNLAQIPD